jgi:hypothetical protein
MENDFILAQMSEDDAAPYLCGQNPEQPEGAEYYGVLFRFKTRGGGILGLLWSRENNRWRVISYREFEQ